jgi:ubiquinone/menaquinone biosynthesis C-methylase UbiE
VVDVGSGPGQHSALIASRHRLMPIQIDANLEMLRRSTLPQSPRCQSLASELPIRSGSADIVIASLILHHLPRTDQFHLLTELHRVSKVGAALLFVDQVRSEGLGGLEYNELVRRQFYRHLHPSDALGRFDSAKENPQPVLELRRMISDAGFALLADLMLGEVVWAARGSAIDCSNNHAR